MLINSFHLALSCIAMWSFSVDVWANVERVDGGQENPSHARLSLQTSRCIWVTGAWLIREVVSPKSPSLLGWWSGKTFVNGVPCPTCRKVHQSLTLPGRHLTWIQLTEGRETLTSFLQVLQASWVSFSPKVNPFYQTETVTQYPYSKLGDIKNAMLSIFLHVWWTTY